MAATKGSMSAPAAAPDAASDGLGEQNYVDWPAILVGAVVATAITLILTTFGSAIGLSFVDFDEGTPGTGLTIALALWTVWVLVSSFMAGAYLAGRLRRRVPDATDHEADMRDGAHGLAVWGVGVLAGALLVAAGATTTANVGARAVSGAASGAASATEAVAAGLEDSDYAGLVDQLLRPSSEAADPAARGNRQAAGEEIGRILRSAGAEGVGEEDGDYLAAVVAERTGLSEEEAAARVEQVSNRLQSLEQEALDAAEAARQTAVLAAFVLAASLLIAGAGAWWAAGMGGQHRDEQTVFALFGRRR